MIEDLADFFEELSAKIKILGIGEGDVLYVASDVTRIMTNAVRTFKLRGRKGMDAFLSRLTDLFQETVGEAGTLLFPIFSWSFCRGDDFDILKTEGDTGSFSNWILKNRKDFRRTQHPMYSFLVWGRDADLLCEMRNLSGWGTDSPFGYFHRKNAKLLMIDVTPGKCNTFHHYIEETIHVPYRYYKDFVSGYICADGHRERRKYRLYVRDLSIESEELPLDEFYDEHHLQKKEEFFGITLRTARLGEVFQPLADDLLSHKGEHIYEFRDYQVDWTVGQTHEDDVII